MPTPTSRLAPSPTGALHLGNARTFFINWAMARQSNWNLVMRLEDLDGPRVKQDAAKSTLDTLHWLGLDWDGEVLVQSDDLEPYRESVERLCRLGRAYTCDLSRAEINQAASAPHSTEHETAFPPALRPETAGQPCPFDPEDANIRFLTSGPPIEIHDGYCGHSKHDVATVPGDFVIWTRRGTPSYQLAVIIDDARQGVTDVVRGDDLLSSAARQTLLGQALDLPIPNWWHVPLVLGPDGHRLAKRHGDTRLTHYRERGVRPERILGLLAHWCGLTEERCELNIHDVLPAFDPQLIPREPITMTTEEERWLCCD